MIGFDLLNDLFKNNIDYTAKSLQILVDHLFPSNEDNSETPVNASDYPLIINGQCVCQHGYVWNGGNRDSMQSYYNFYYNSMSDNNAFSWVTWYNNPSDSAIADFNSVTSVNDLWLKPYTLGPDKLLQYYGDTWYIYNNTSYGGVGVNYYNRETVAYPFEYQNKSTYVYFGTERYCEFGSNEARIYLLGSGDRKIVLTDDLTSATTIYNNYINFDNDYHTSNTYNFNGGSGNGGGSVFVGGGAGGFVICPIGAVGYADIKFSLDSLFDDLNLNFNITSNKYPVDSFPSYDEIKYEDMGSFYITPIKQLDTLPVAPDIADTVIDVSEPLSILTTGFGALLSSFDSLGVTLTLTFTFLSCLIINKLRGD